MSRKRPSVIDTLDIAPQRLETSKVVTLPPPVIERPAARATPRIEVQHTSIYVPKPAYRKIREIAVAGDRKAHDVIIEGIDLVLAKYGFPTVAEFKNGKA
jgi:hypothetical protein